MARLSSHVARELRVLGNNKDDLGDGFLIYTYTATTSLSLSKYSAVDHLIRTASDIYILGIPAAFPIHKVSWNVWVSPTQLSSFFSLSLLSFHVTRVAHPPRNSMCF